MNRSSSSDRQPDLLGGHAPPQVHRLFFALMPDADVAERIQAAAAQVAAGQHLHARLIRASRYHATLHFLGDHAMLREDIARAAMAAAARVRAQPFELVLDSSSSFHGREPPCVLRCSQIPEGLQRLWHDLQQSLSLAGLGRHLSRQFTPHVTFAYSRGGMPEPAAIAPIRWRVEGFSLLHSVVGGGDYQVLDAWRFQAP